MLNLCNEINKDAKFLWVLSNKATVLKDLKSLRNFRLFTYNKDHRNGLPSVDTMV